MARTSNTWTDTDDGVWTDTDDGVWTDWFSHPPVIAIESLGLKYEIFDAGTKYQLKTLG